MKKTIKFFGIAVCLVAAIAAMCLFAACNETVSVEKVTLDKTELTLEAGKTATLTATVAPDNASDKSVTWASDKTDIATVDNGKVTAVAAGTAKITVTTKDGGKTATCSVTVTNPAPTEKTAVTAPAISSKVYNGSKQKADVTDTDKYTVTTNNGGTDVGEYDVVLTLKDTANYKWADSDQATKTLKFNITKASATVVWNAESSYAYTGKVLTAPTATATGVGSDGALTLTVTLTIPAQGTFKDVGSYTFTAALNEANSKNYTLSGDTAKTVTVAKATGTVEVATAEELGKALEFTDSGATIKLTADFDTIQRFDIDKTLTLDLNGKTITAKAESTETYLFYVNETGVLTINGDGTITSAKQIPVSVWDSESVTKDNLTTRLIINGGTFTNTITGKDGNHEAVYIGRGKAEIKGGEFKSADTISDNVYRTINCNDASFAAEKAKVVISGGRFYKFNPAKSGESGNPSFLEQDYYTTQGTDEYYTVKAATGTIEVATAQELNDAFKYAKTDATIKLMNEEALKLTAQVPAVTNKALTLDMNGKTIIADRPDTEKQNDDYSEYLFAVMDGGKLTVKGSGTINSEYQIPFTVCDKTVEAGSLTSGLVIENGEFTSKSSVVVYVYNGQAEILGGSFKSEDTTHNTGDKNFTLNCKNDQAVANKAKIIVKGGTFHNFNPAAIKNDDTGAGQATNYVDSGYTSAKDNSLEIWTVSKNAE